MRNDDHGRIALIEHVFEPADRIDVEVVGRLIQQQHVGVGKQRLREQHAQLPAGCDPAHGAVVLVDRNADTEQQFARAGLGGVTVVFGKARFQVSRAHIVVVGGFRVRVDRVALRHRLPHLGVPHHHHVQHAHFLVAELVLLELAQTHVGLEHHGAARGLQIAAEDLHEGRLAAAVRADQAVAVAFAELDGDVFEQGLGPELHGDIGGRQHCASLGYLISQQLVASKKS